MQGKFGCKNCLLGPSFKLTQVTCVIAWLGYKKERKVTALPTTKSLKLGRSKTEFFMSFAKITQNVFIF